MILLYSLFFMSCKKNDKKSLLEFNPRMITSLDLNKTDSIFLEKYYLNKKIYSGWVGFKFKSKVDTAYTEFKKAKYDFRLKQNFVQNHDYKLIFYIENRKYSYFFQKIDYDTIRNGPNIFYDTKSYVLNSKKYDNYDAVYYLEKPDAPPLPPPAGPSRNSIKASAMPLARTHKVEPQTSATQNKSIIQKSNK